jgi:hypothetical protein
MFRQEERELRPLDVDVGSVVLPHDLPAALQRLGTEQRSI